MANVSRSITEARDAEVIAGIKKDLQNVPSLPLAGTTYTIAALQQLVQSRIDAATAIVNARADWLHAVATYRAVDTQVTKLVRSLRQYVINAFGEDSPKLADFGFTAPKVTTLTPAEKAARAQKAKATREARGTMGKKQKRAIKGAPTAAPATPTPASKPTP